MMMRTVIVLSFVAALAGCDKTKDAAPPSPAATAVATTPTTALAPTGPSGAAVAPSGAAVAPSGAAAAPSGAAVAPTGASASGAAHPHADADKTKGQKIGPRVPVGPTGAATPGMPAGNPENGTLRYDPPPAQNPPSQNPAAKNPPAKKPETTL